MAADLLLLCDVFMESDDSLDTDVVIHEKKTTERLFTVIAVTSSLKGQRTKKIRMKDYFERVVPMYNIDDFRQRFRISRSTFQFLLDHLQNILSKGTKGGQVKIPPEKQLLVFIKYLSSQQTLQEIADVFGMCESSVYVIINRSAEAICSNILSELITWPNRQETVDIAARFAQSHHFPGVIGAIDGTHIPIKAPVNHPEDYINRKQFSSVILQAVCNDKLSFTDVYCGWPGSVHDARVLRNSPLFINTQNDEVKMFPNNTHLLGDAAYGLNTWLLTPFKDYGNLRKDQKKYNYCHSATRMAIERAFGILKGRFRRLKYIDISDMENIVAVVLSCCVLHQVCLLQNDEMGEFLDEPHDPEVINYDVQRDNQTALLKRQSIMEELRN